MTTRAPSSARPKMDARIRARRIAVSKAEARRRRRFLASGVGALGLILAMAAAARSPLFAISEIRFVGVSGDRLEELADYTPISKGQNLLDVDLGEVERRLARVPWLQAVTVVRRPPSTVEVRVQQRQPAAAVELAGAVWTVDAEGYVLSPGAGEGLAVIEAPASVLPGVGTQAIDAAVRNALAVQAALPPRWREAVERYDAPSERGLRLLLNGQDLNDRAINGGKSNDSDTGEVWVRFGSADRVQEKVKVLVALLAEVEKAPVPVAEIDVRAPGNPVLVPAGIT